MKSRVFSPVNTHRLEDSERLKWLPPAEVLDRLDVAPGMVVADVGAGTGYFSLPLARAVSHGGKVYAIDFQTEILAVLARKLELGNPGNILLVDGNAAETTLADRSCDLVLMANIWHELDNAAAVLKEAKRIVRHGGRLAILDWRPDVTGAPGPPLEIRRSADQVSDLVTAHGWELQASNNVGCYSYLLVFHIAAANW